jgi:beta-mannosidase
MDEEFVFSREFDYTATSKKTLLVCEGLDTLCDVYLNGKFVAHTDNMHRSYYFDVSQFLVEGKNEIKAVFPPFDAYIKKKLAEDYFRLRIAQSRKAR